MAITRQEYHDDTTRVSKSGLDCFDKSPLHYWDRYLNPDHPDRVNKKHFKVGDVCNDLILIPDEFKTLYYVLPVGSPKKPTEAQLAAKRPSPETLRTIEYWNKITGENPGKTIVLPDEWDTARWVRDAVMKHRPAAELLKKGEAERTIYFTEPMTGAQCKVRPDWLATDARFITDLKTTIDASPEGFGRAAWNYKYDKQGAFYYDGVVYGLGEFYDGFAFIAAEKTRPFPVKVYYMDDDDFKVGRRRYMRNLEMYVECKRQNKWPGYGDLVERIKLPNYVFNT